MAKFRIPIPRTPVNRAEKWKSRDSVLDSWPCLASACEATGAQETLR
jgi:hypothetical protein